MNTTLVLISLLYMTWASEKVSIIRCEHAGYLWIYNR
jgi:hypothetical protein